LEVPSRERSHIPLGEEENHKCQTGWDRLVFSRVFITEGNNIVRPESTGMISLIFVALALIFEQTFGRRSVFHIKTLIRVDKSIRKEFSPNNTDLIQAKGFDETKLLKNIVLY